MTVAIQTTSAVLATLVAAGNRGSTIVESGGTYTISHSDRLVILVSWGKRAGYSDSVPYSYPNLTGGWATITDDLTITGVVVCHDHRKLVIEASGTAMSFQTSTQPDRDGTLNSIAKLARTY